MKPLNVIVCSKPWLRAELSIVLVDHLRRQTPPQPANSLDMEVPSVRTVSSAPGKDAKNLHLQTLLGKERSFAPGLLADEPRLWIVAGTRSVDYADASVISLGDDIGEAIVEEQFEPDIEVFRMKLLNSGHGILLIT